ncbi:MAG: Asp-tRNA(Asn)/Glu-tRNA(Gln) amidotransferase subunit GatC [Atopobiaceae bacterium]|nr:Asp-tRNA(Asn)/Glu-tRNA(Gln) amidotransferase subunit GatC [Atopobiaceae bacterium]
MSPDQPLSKEDVAGIAEYARIALTEAELDEMTTYLNDAVALLAPIREYDLEGVEPTFHPIGSLVNVMGEDIVDATDRALPLEVALKNASTCVDRSFRVPSILGEQGGDR